MQEFFSKFLEYLPFIMIPFISGFVGWGTNVLALKMTFYPLEYKGVKPFGWQGIVPSKAAKMARISVELMTAKLIDIKEIFSRLDSQKIAEIIKPGISKLSVKIVDEIMDSQLPLLWKISPKSFKQKIYDEIIHEIPEITKNIMEDLKFNIEEVIDLKALAVTILVNDKALINQIFLEVGKKEFKFIERSGFYFGFLFGLVQMITFIYYNPWWMLPVAGLIVGYLTNFLAIKMIFRPVKAINIFGYKLQGIFFKRQTEVAKEYSQIVTSKVVTTENLFDFIMRGPNTKKVDQILNKHISRLINKISTEFDKILKALGGKNQLDIIKNIAVYRFKEELPLEVPPMYEYSEKMMDLSNTMATKMAALSAPEFESFLHPVFEEDELKLILIGAFLGGLAGLIQYFLFFY